MIDSTKRHGRIYTPDYLVKTILDFGGYHSAPILQKHVIDNSCGDGAFLTEIVQRYCTAFTQHCNNIDALREALETYIHGIEIDHEEWAKCIANIDLIANHYGIAKVAWDIHCDDTLQVDRYDHKMDYVFGNPPYVRVHHLEESYTAVKNYHFAATGMTDLFIVFFEIGFQMLSPQGMMCLITPNSWLTSKAGTGLRHYILHHKNLTGLIDLEHFQPFQATTYTMIARFETANRHEQIDYYRFDNQTLQPYQRESIALNEMTIASAFYPLPAKQLQTFREIRNGNSAKLVVVKNGFATLADKIFICDFTFQQGTIDILKASTGKWTKCIFPYHADGSPMSLDDLRAMPDIYTYLEAHKKHLTAGRDVEQTDAWYLFGRTQALKDVAKKKYAINTVIKDIQSIRLEEVAAGKGIYSGLYLLTDIAFETLQEIILNDSFIAYIKMLKKYKSGGYYTFSSNDLELYLNHNITERYGESRIPTSSYRLF